MNKGLLIVGALLGVAAIAYFATSQTKTGEKMPAASPSSEVSVPTSASAEPKAEKMITVSGSEYSFTPSSVNLMAEEEVTLVYKNTGKLPHDLVINELGVKTNVIAGGKEDSVTFTPEKSGTFTFYCSVGNHRQLGMEGTLSIQ